MSINGWLGLVLRLRVARLTRRARVSDVFVNLMRIAFDEHRSKTEAQGRAERKDAGF